MGQSTNLYAPAGGLRWLLVRHPREAARASNTGQLLLEPPVSATCEDWSRAAPSEPARAGESQYLVYPGPESTRESQGWGAEAWAEIQRGLARGGGVRLILLDGTWQESWTMFRRSPGLHHLPRLALRIEESSCFRLRTGHRPGQVSTVETVIEVLRRLDRPGLADQLSLRFHRFMGDYAEGRIRGPRQA